MQLKKLILEKFRNYEKLELNFNPTEPMTYIIGQNAQGKTNILEAIYLLALTKSFRTGSNENLIQWGQQYCRIVGEFVENSATSTEPQEISPRGETQTQGENSTTLEVFFGNPPQPLKSVKKNGAKSTIENFIGNCQTVFFHPEDLNMLYLGPDLRRRYLDLLNLQINKNYYRALRTFKQVIKQRNALLKEIKQGSAPRAELPVWNEQLATAGSILILERAKSVAFFRQYLEEYYQKIAESKDKIGIFYKNTVLEQTLPAEAPSQSQLGQNLPTGDQLKTAYLQSLEKAEKIDLQAEITTIGPHRDDLEFKLNNRPLAAHASRGEYRSLLLAMKLLEVKFFQEKSQTKPILLLDDVFSELDLNRQKMLLEAIEGHQTIVTATHLDQFTSQFAAGRTHAGGQQFKIQSGALMKQI